MVTRGGARAFERTKTGREKMQALMQQQRTEVGAVTAEQQQTFDKNVAQLRSDRRSSKGEGSIADTGALDQLPQTSGSDVRCQVAERLAGGRVIGSPRLFLTTDT